MLIKFFVFCFLSLSVLFGSEKIIINYPLTSSIVERDAYQVSVVKFLLEKANVDYEIRHSKKIYSQARAMRELKKGKDLNLFWVGTSPQLEEEFIPVRFPLYRGLIGHRVFIINKNDQVLFNNVDSLERLQKFIGVQGIGWSDIAILEASGLHQHTAKYENIFNMINNGGRVSYFSRSINEAYSEVSMRNKTLTGLAVEKNIVLVYPFAMFLFVSPNDEKLAKILNDSFEKAYADGSFEKFFYNHPIIKESIDISKLDERIRIEIPNPFLTVKTSEIDKKYWHGKFTKDK